MRMVAVAIRRNASRHDATIKSEDVFAFSRITAHIECGAIIIVTRRVYASPMSITKPR